MGMPATVDIADAPASKEDSEKVFSYFDYVDKKFSTYKENSEITSINEGKLSESEWSEEMKEVFSLAEETKRRRMVILTSGGRTAKLTRRGLLRAGQ